MSADEQKPEPAVCSVCGAPLGDVSVPCASFTRLAPTVCDTCSERLAEEREKKRKRDAADALWHAVCPPLYRNTDAMRLPKSFQDAVSKWRYGPTGVGFIGHSGCGKTRAAYLLLKKALSEGRTVMAVNAVGYAHNCAMQFEDERAREAIDRFKRSDVLLFDDFGKGRMTERAELEIYGLLEYRTSHMLPTIWTANSTPEELNRMMTEDRGKAVMRRMCEFADIYAP